MGHKIRSKKGGHRPKSGGGVYEQQAQLAGDFVQQCSVPDIQACGNGGFAQQSCSGFPNVGLASSSGFYSVTLADGQCIEVRESDLRQSSRSNNKFSCFVNGAKHKIRLNQIQPCSNFSQSCSISAAPAGYSNYGGVAPGGYSTGGYNNNIGSCTIATVGPAADGDILRVRSATPAAGIGGVEYIHQVNTVSARPSPVTFYPYYKIKIGDSVKVLPYHIVSAGKASRRFFRFRYDGKTITVRKNHVRPVTRHYKVILDGRVTDISCHNIQPYGDNAYLVTHNGVERIVGSASVHSGVQDGAELITDDEGSPGGHHISSSSRTLWVVPRDSKRSGSSASHSQGPKEDPETGRRFGLIKRYTKTTKGKRVRKVPRRKSGTSKSDLKIFDVSFCLCYQIILNGAHIVIPQHRIKQSKRHTGYMRFRYNRMVYYITPQTITQAFYAPVVGYYSIVIDEKVVVVSGREMEKHSEREDIFIVRYNDETYEVHAASITFLGEFVLEPDSEQVFDDQGEDTPISSEESDTSDSDASVSGRDELIEDAAVYTTRTFDVRHRGSTTCYRIRLNGSEIVVPVSQVTQCKTRPGMYRITYYGKTYFISQEDIELQYETEVTGFYSVTINGTPVVLTGDNIENGNDGTYICYYKNSRYVIAQTMIMYLGDYPITHAPNYVDSDYGSSDDGSVASEWGPDGIKIPGTGRHRGDRGRDSSDDDEYSEEEPQMCIFVNEKPNLDMKLPEPTQGSVMGWKVYIDGRFYTVPANRLKQLRNAPGFMEIIVNRKLYHVSIENIQPIMLPTVYFITIQNKPILVPAKDVRRHPTEDGAVIVKYRGQDYVIPVGELKLADGSSVNYDDIPMDQEYLITRTSTSTTTTIRRRKKKGPKGPEFFRTCSPLCTKVALMSGSDTEAAPINPNALAEMANISGATGPDGTVSFGGPSHILAPGGVIMGQGGFGGHLSLRPSSRDGMVQVGLSAGEPLVCGGGMIQSPASILASGGGYGPSGGISGGISSGGLSGGMSAGLCFTPGHTHGSGGLGLQVQPGSGGYGSMTTSGGRGLGLISPGGYSGGRGPSGLAVSSGGGRSVGFAPGGGQTLVQPRLNSGGVNVISGGLGGSGYGIGGQGLSGHGLSGHGISGLGSSGLGSSGGKHSGGRHSGGKHSHGRRRKQSSSSSSSDSD